jgi:oligosaccharide repeat unit polymerase
MYDARFTYLPTVGGVTTLTQFGSACMIFGALLGVCQGWRAVRLRLGIIALLALLRVLINSERFALVELVVPFLLTRLALEYIGSQNAHRRTRQVLAVAPVLAMTALLFFFTGFEYFRSWSNYYSDRDMSLLEFGSTRLAGYYVTSFNNGAYFMNRLEPLKAPYFTLHFLWGFPLTSPVIQRLFPDQMLQSTEKWFYFPFLEAEANLEFNNADGFLFPLMDYGIPGGLIYWLVMGVVCGWLYQSFQRRSLAGLLMYPMTYLSLMELPLALYWGEGRAFPSLCLLAGVPMALWFARGMGAADFRPQRLAAAVQAESICLKSH